MTISSSRVTKTLFVIVCILTLSVVAYNFYTFSYVKNYEFIVEVPCDSSQSCFVRYCDENEECPPNELEQYRMFTLNASDYEKCLDGSCLNECVSGAIQCTEIVCGESEEDLCTQVEIEEDVVEEVVEEEV
jgi:hypothetical protein